MWVQVVNGNENKPDNKAGLELLRTHGTWVKTVIASNPFASEEELLSFFVKHGFPESETRRWIACQQRPLDDY